MFQGIFKSAIKMPDTNTNYIFGTGSIPIQIKTAQLATFADGTTKQQGYQVAEVNKLISTMLTGWGADGSKPKSMLDNYLELILSCNNGFVIKKKLQFPHIIAWQDDSTPYNIADVYKEFSIDNWLKADDFENPDITLVVEPTDEILTTSMATPPEVTTEQSGRFYLYYRNLPVGVNRIHIDFHIKTKTEPIDFDLEVIDGLSWKDAQVILSSNAQAKINVLLSTVKDVYNFTGAEGNFENITIHEWSELYQQIISLKPNNKFTHDLYFYLYEESEISITELEGTLGYGLCKINVTQGSSHSSNFDRINVDIKAGEKFYISGTMLGGNVTTFSIFVKYINQVSTVNIGYVNVGQGYKEFIASNDIESLGYYIEGSHITASGQISIVSLFGIYAKSQETKSELEAKMQELNNNINKQFVMVDITDALNASYKNITLNTVEKKVTIKSKGLRLKALGKSFTLSGTTDFVMPYTESLYPNGAWLLSMDAVKNIKDGGKIELSSENIYYLDVNAPNYRKDITLFPCYYDTIIPTGLFGEILLQRQIEAIAGSVDIPTLMRDNAFNSVYNSTDISVKQKEYTALINNTGKTEQFIFFTDPHLLGSANTFSLPTLKQYIGLLQKYYNCLPVDFVLSGGDWLNNGDYQVTACDKLGYMDATMRKLFKHYYPILGNHDTNYQGVISADDSTRGDLSQQTIINLMFRDNKNAYYDFIGNNTRFFVFDTQIDWDTTLNVYKYQQLKWFAESLTNNKDENIVIVQHIFYTYDQVVNPISEKIQDIAGAFNSRTTITIDGQQYDFTNCNGYIRCAIAGHSHTDEIITNTNVPVVLTADMQKGNTPTFDICLIDYGANKMYLVRVGTGVSRELDLFVGNN